MKKIVIFFLFLPFVGIGQWGVGVFGGSQNLHMNKRVKQHFYTAGTELRIQGVRWFAHFYFRQTFKNSKEFEAQYDSGIGGFNDYTTSQVELSAFYVGAGGGVTFSRTASRTRPYMFLDIGQGKIKLNASNAANAEEFYIQNKRVKNGIRELSDFQMRFSMGFQFQLKKTSCIFYEASIFAGTTHPFADWSYAIDLGYRYYFK